MVRSYKVLVKKQGNMGIDIVDPGPSFSWGQFCSCNKSKYQEIVQCKRLVFQCSSEMHCFNILFIKLYDDSEIPCCSSQPLCAYVSSFNICS